MSLSWAWFFLLLATYPWLLGVDLLTDASAGAGVGLCISGAVIIAPCQRLRRWQGVLFAASVGFLYEAFRPVPDGSVALVLVVGAIFLTSNRPFIRDLPFMFRGAILMNSLVCTSWFVASALHHQAQIPLLSLHFLGQWLLHLLCAAVLAIFLLVPIAIVQNFTMDKVGVPKADEVV